MKISIQNMIISIASGVGAFAISLPLIKQASLFLGPAVAAGLWAYFSKQEAKTKKSGDEGNS
jgi:hypothetical protein